MEGVVPASRGYKATAGCAVPGAGTFRATSALARRLLDSDVPLGRNPLGAPAPNWVFLTKADLASGKDRATLFGTHVLLLSAAALNATAGLANAVPYPSDAFVKVWDGWVA